MNPCLITYGINHRYNKEIDNRLLIPLDFLDSETYIFKFLIYDKINKRDDIILSYRKITQNDYLILDLRYIKGIWINHKQYFINTTKEDIQDIYNYYYSYKSTEFNINIITDKLNDYIKFVKFV